MDERWVDDSPWTFGQLSRNPETCGLLFTSPLLLLDGPHTCNWAGLLASSSVTRHSPGGLDVSVEFVEGWARARKVIAKKKKQYISVTGLGFSLHKGCLLSFRSPYLRWCVLSRKPVCQAGKMGRDAESMVTTPPWSWLVLVYLPTYLPIYIYTYPLTSLYTYGKIGRSLILAIFTGRQV